MPLYIHYHAKQALLVLIAIGMAFAAAYWLRFDAPIWGAF